MTFEELELRVMAALPEAVIKPFDDYLAVTLIPEQTIAGWPTDLFDCRTSRPRVLMSYDVAVGDAAIADVEAARTEIERRILSVTAHQRIALAKSLNDVRENIL